MNELPASPFDNPSILGVAPRMRALQREGPITRVRAVGEEAWLVTRYDEVKALLSDRRLGLSDPKPQPAAKNTARITVVALMAGDDYDTEATGHPRMRELLVPRFSTRRMRLMKTRIEHHVDELLAQLATSTVPVDLLARAQRRLGWRLTAAGWRAQPGRRRRAGTRR